MKILLAGGKGLLGTSITPFFKNRFDVAVFDIDEWDITDQASGESIVIRERPDVLINCAAMTDVDGCEDRKELAERVNSRGPAILGDICSRHNIRLVQIGTDYVFDGTKGLPYNEEDVPNPISCYGKTKLWGEQHVIARDPSSLVVRTQWLYGEGGPHFISKIVNAARENGSVRVVNDQTGSPTYARDLAEPLAVLIAKRGSGGIYHISDSGSCTWYDLACEVFSTLGMDVQVTPVSSRAFNRKAVRPSYSVFDMRKVQRETGIVMRSWQEALREYLRNNRV